MALLLGALLAMGALAVVIWPFLRGAGGAASREASPSARMLETRQRREAIYREMRTLEMEHSLGQVDPRDYQDRLQRHRLDAAAALRQEEGLALWVSRLDQAVEEEIQAASHSFNDVEDPTEGRRD